MSEKSKGCFDLFLNLIISQLFIGCVGSIIELIRLFVMNFITKTFFSSNFIRNYGIYINPILTTLLLFILSISIYYTFDLVPPDTNSTIIYSLLFLFLISILFIFIIYFITLLIKSFTFKYTKVSYQNS